MAFSHGERYRRGWRSLIDIADSKTTTRIAKKYFSFRSTIHPLTWVHGRRKGGLDLLAFENLAKKVVFLVSSGKKQISPLLALLEKFWKNSLVAPLEKIPPTPMFGCLRYAGLCFQRFGRSPNMTCESNQWCSYLLTSLIYVFTWPFLSVSPSVLWFDVLYFIDF